MKWATILLVACLLLAGCFGGKNKPDREDDPPITPPPPPPDVCAGPSPPPSCLPTIDNKTTGHSMELLGCDTYFLSYQADADKLQDLMPDGYSPSPLIGNVQGVGLDAFFCDSVVIDNHTVVSDYHFFTVGAGATVPEEVRSNDRSNAYIFEYVVNSPLVLALLTEAGFHATLGDVERNILGQTIQLGFLTSTGRLYDYAGAGILGNGSTHLGFADRIHQANETTRAWYDSDQDANLPQIVGEAGPLQVHGGVIAETALAPGPVIPADSGAGRANYFFQFPPVYGDTI